MVVRSANQHVKYDPQSSHFNKSQYSLHCTVQHTSNDEAKYDYLYHLSDVMKHDHAFTSAAVDHILDVKGIPSIIRLTLTAVRLNTNANGYFVSGILLHKKTILK